MTDPNDPAFAIQGFSQGLTKRELFAAMAMQGAINMGGNVGWDTADLLTKYAVEVADALILELSK